MHSYESLNVHLLKSLCTKILLKIQHPHKNTRAGKQAQGNDTESLFSVILAQVSWSNSFLIKISR